MIYRSLLFASVVMLLTMSPTATVAEEPAAAAHKAIERSLDFLEKDAVKWRTERGCSTCHHGTMTVWALSEAKGRGYAVPAEAIAENLQWTKSRLLARIDLPRDERRPDNALRYRDLGRSGNAQEENGRAWRGTHR